MTGSGINFRHNRVWFIDRNICPCDPTTGDSCPLCDGTDADERELAADLRRRARSWRPARRAAVGEAS